MRLSDISFYSSTDGQRENSLGMILDCVAAPHDPGPYLSALKTNGHLVLVGIPDTPHKSPDVMPMVFKRLSISGTSIGSINETQQMLDFCGQYHIVSEVEVIRLDEVKQAFERMLKGDVKYRFVIDMKAGK
ncbi:alcohol dehydrogenase [Erwinia pyrifoliae]|nr:alcohol dehydrogenase [Erwinia pyrifoliae]